MAELAFMHSMAQHDTSTEHWEEKRREGHKEQQDIHMRLLLCVAKHRMRPLLDTATLLRDIKTVF